MIKLVSKASLRLFVSANSLNFRNVSFEQSDNRVPIYMHFIAHFSVFIAYRRRETIIYSKVENCLTAANRLALAISA